MKNRSSALLQILARILPFFALMPFALGVTSAEDPGTTEPETEEEKKKREEKEKEEAAKKQKAEDDKKKEEEAKAKAAAAQKPGLSACLKGALASLAGGSPAVASAALAAEKTAHAATRATLTQSQADLATARASLASTEASLAAVCGFLGVQVSAVSGLAAADVHAVLQSKIGAEAIAQLASLGVNPGRLPAPTSSASASSKTVTPAEFAAFTPAEKSKFSRAGGRIVD